MLTVCLSVCLCMHCVCVHIYLYEHSYSVLLSPSVTARFRWLRLARGILCRHPSGISSRSLRSAGN